MHKLAASFWKSTKISQNQGIKSNEKLDNVKGAITENIYDVYLFTFID